MKPVKTSLWDPVEYLETEEDLIFYLEEVFKIGDPDLIITAIGDVSRARGMSRSAARGESLSHEHNPSFSTVMEVMASLGFRLSPRIISSAS